MIFTRRKAPHQMNDAELVEAVYDGNEDAIVYMFYQKYSATFQYHIYNIFQFRENVSELVDELFLYLYQDNWRRLRTYDPRKASLSTWISMVSYRFFKNFQHSRIDYNGVIFISDKWETFRGDWPQSCDAGIEMDVRAAISEIRNERDREIAELLLIHDRPYEEIAERFGMSVDYVYTVKNRILKTLRKKLEAYG